MEIDPLPTRGSLDVSIDICLYWSVPNIVIDPDYLRFEWRLTVDQGIIKLISSRFWNLYWYSFRLVQISVSISIFNVILCYLSLFIEKNLTYTLSSSKKKNIKILDRIYLYIFFLCSAQKFAHLSITLSKFIRTAVTQLNVWQIYIYIATQIYSHALGAAGSLMNGSLRDRFPINVMYTWRLRLTDSRYLSRLLRCLVNTSSAVLSYLWACSANWQVAWEHPRCFP